MLWPPLRAGEEGRRKRGVGKERERNNARKRKGREVLQTQMVSIYIYTVEKTAVLAASMGSYLRQYLQPAHIYLSQSVENLGLKRSKVNVTKQTVKNQVFCEWFHKKEIL